MLFNTLAYLLFLPLVFLLYWARRKRLWQNGVVVAASLLFYGWWDVRFLALMVATCLVNYTLVRGLFVTAKRRIAKLMVGAGIVTNFAILAVFKYFNFFAGSLAEVMHAIPLFAACADALDSVTLNVVLPVGISFYTFQLSAYLIDSYRDRQDAYASVPEKGADVAPPSLLTFFSFITFFPQLVAGPIERGRDLMVQMQACRQFDYRQAREGMRLLLWGLMKKMLLADNCAHVANMIFEDYASATTIDLWLGALLFTFQIYGDFSGYSDMAIGSARLLGIRLSCNFDKPYFSTSIPEFWRRWHITLMSWFKDYVYIPLGGSRCSEFRHQMNVLAVFALSGLWHGSNWTFVLWGIYHALWFRFPFKRIGVLITFPAVVIGWVIFRSPDVTTAFHYIAGMFDVMHPGTFGYSRAPLAIILPFVITEWLMRHHEHPFVFRSSGMLSHQLVRNAIYLACFCLTLYFGGKQVDFIYFQF